MPLFVNVTVCNSCSEVYYNEWTYAIFMDRSYCIDNAVRSNLTRIIIFDIQSCFDTGTYDEGSYMEILSTHLFKSIHNRWHDRRYNNSFDILKCKAFMREK